MLKKAWIRFKSQVPQWVKKTQIVLGMAAASLTTAAAINWPGKLETVGNACTYGAAVCGAIVIGLQFIQETATIFEQPAQQDN